MYIQQSKNKTTEFPQITSNKFQNTIQGSKIQQLSLLNKEIQNRKLKKLSSQLVPVFSKKRISEMNTGEQLPFNPNTVNTSIKKIQIQKNLEHKKKKQNQVGQQKSNQVKIKFGNPTIYNSKSANNGKNSIESSIKNSSNSNDTIMQEFLFIVNLSNNYIVDNKSCTFKAFIDKGNNGLLVKSIVKRRWWWYLIEDKQSDKSNLVWSQWLCKQFSQKLQISQNCDLVKKKEQIDIFSNKQLSKLKNTVKTESVDGKKQKIGKLLNLQFYDKINIKISKQQDSYFTFNKKIKEKGSELMHDLSFLNNQRIIESNQQAKIHNHIEGGLNLHSKKSLFNNLRKYYQSIGKDPFQYIPLTFHIKQGREDQQFLHLLQYYDNIEKQKNLLQQEKKSKKKKIYNIWICKPGQNSNRGNGISVVDKKQDLIELVKALQTSNYKRSLIIQKYLQNPFLIQKRKFDIRCYILITTYNGILKGYWFDQGYIRTTSEQFTLQNIENKMIHLTNDAIQKKGKQYGKFENANKMSFNQFSDYLQNKYKYQKSKFKNSYQQIKNIARDLIQSVYQKLNPKKKQYAFQLFGLDFMLDSNLKPWLIEANSNPCLDTTGPLLGRLIPEVVENVFKIAIDPLFPPPTDQQSKMKSKIKINYFESNKFILIFDSIEIELKSQKIKRQKTITKEQQRPTTQK